MPEEIDYFSQLPPEMMQEMFEMLPPTELARIREASVLAANNVDAYVRHLIDSEQLVDDFLKPVEAGIPQALQGWANGDFHRVETAQPDPNQVFDIVFSDTGQDYDRQRAILRTYNTAMNDISADGLQFKEYVLDYIHHLLQNDRLIYEDYSTPAQNADPQSTFEAWMRGTLIWRQP